MGKIYELYGPDERRIDNLKRRIRGYEKMKKDITNQNRKLNKQNRELRIQLKERQEIINKYEKAISKVLELIEHCNKDWECVDIIYKEERETICSSDFNEGALIVKDILEGALDKEDLQVTYLDGHRR